jgi:hypothetical protein
VDDLTACTKGPGTDCLRATIDFDINGIELVPGERTWTGTSTDGTADSPNCNNWTSNSANDQGSGGNTPFIDAGWTTEAQGQGPGSCDQRRRLICFHIQSG